MSTSTVPESIAIKVDHSKCPPVGFGGIQKAIVKAHELMQLHPGDEQRVHDEFMEWIPSNWHRETALATWARLCALLAWNQLPHVQESTRLWREALAIEKAVSPESVDPLWEMQLESVARCRAAAKHPLTAEGRFTDGFAFRLESERRTVAAMLAAEYPNAA